MKNFTFLVIAVLAYVSIAAQIPNYRRADTDPNANYYSIVKAWRAKFKVKEQEFKRTANPSKESSEQLREEIAHFERWAAFWRDRVNVKGQFPSAAQGWINILKENPSSLVNVNAQARTQAAVWTSLGPRDSAITNNVKMAPGIGRVNVIRKHPAKPILFAGTSTGGIFKSTNMGDNWVPVTDALAGLGISDIVIDPVNPSIMYAATGDWDKQDFISSIGVFKSTDEGNTWNPTGLTFTLDKSYRIAHLAIDPANTNIIYATGKDSIHRSENGGNSWTTSTTPPPLPDTSYYFNDIVKIGDVWYVSDRLGSIYKSAPLVSGVAVAFTQAYNNGRKERLDFAWSPANSDSLYLLSQSNPAFAKFSIVDEKATPYSNITNANPEDKEANFNTQEGYNQVIAVSPTNKDSIWIGEFSGKLSVDGGQTWQNKLNGYYDPSDDDTKWGGFYVHSDHHDFVFLGSDTLLIGNDGGAYVGKVSTNNYQQKFNGLVATQSYSISIFDTEPSNLITGNQDNDGSSRVTENSESKFYAAQAGDGTSTAISRTDHLLRYLGSQKGGLKYRNDGFKNSYNGTAIATPKINTPFEWELQLHPTNDSILYGGFGDMFKKTNPRSNTTDSTTWIRLNTGISSGIQTFILADNSNTLQKIIVIGEKDTIRRSADESTWTTITPPENVRFNSIYAKKAKWDTLFATAKEYQAANKVFMSIDTGNTWVNITKNFPNIKTKKVVLYEGTDTVFVSTELGMYYARISELSTTSPWSKYGTGLPNVQIEDMEISYAKKQLFIATFGRGIWMADLSPSTALPIRSLQFTYVKAAGGNNLQWKVEDENVVKTVLEKSVDGISFKEIDQFTGSTKTLQPAYKVANESRVTYYRLYYTKATGQKVYSHIIVIRPASVSSMVNVFPNPTKGYIYVSGENQIEHVRIFGSNGQQITFARPMNNYYTFDLSLLPVGTYIIQVRDVKGNNHQQKVIRN